MSLRFFNQDSVENFFAKLCQNGKRFVNPTCSAFTPYYKSLLVNNMTGRHSIGANCQDGKMDILITFIDQEKNSVEMLQLGSFTDIPETILSGNVGRKIEKQALNYVLGRPFSKVTLSNIVTLADKLYWPVQKKSVLSRMNLFWPKNMTTSNPVCNM